MTKRTLTDKEVFEQFKQAAPLEDLRFYLRVAVRTVATYDVPEITLQTVRDMTRLEHSLASTPYKAAHKAQVWTLIDRYKTFLPGWTPRDRWIEPMDSAAVYARAQAELVHSDGPADGEVIEGAEGPISLDDLTRWYERTTAEISAKNASYESPKRDVALTPEQVQEMSRPEPIAQTEATPRRKVTRKVPAFACPSCAGALVLISAGVWACAACRPVEQKRLRAPRPTLVASTDAKTCVACGVEQSIDQFTWGDGGRTVRNMCRTCRKAQQAARRQKAA